MLNEAFIKKYFRLFLLIMIVVILFLGFFWINFIYSNHKKDNEVYAKELEEETFSLIDYRNRQIIRRARDVYEKKQVELQNTIRLRSSLLRSTVYDYYYVLDISPVDIHAKLDAFVKKFRDESGLNVYAVDRKNNLSFGEKPEFSQQAVDKEIVDIGEYYIYKDELVALNMDIYVYVNYADYVRKGMVSDFEKYIELDPGIIAYDSEGKSLNNNPDFQRMPKNEYVITEKDFVGVKKDDVTGFSFGYFISRERIKDIIRDRDQLFSTLLRSHIYELLALFFIIILVGSLIMSRLRNYADKKVEDYNKEIVETYQQGKEVYENANLSDFAYSSALHTIFTQSRKKNDILVKENEYLKRLIRKNQVEILLLKRKVDVQDQDE